MCQKPAVATCAAPVPEKKDRFCRWLDGKAEAREALMSGSNARLLISVTLKNGKVVAEEYVVFRLEDGWHLLKEQCGVVVKSYTLDTTFDENPGLWTCDCDDAVRRGRTQCKHAKGLVRSLREIGLLA